MSTGMTKFHVIKVTFILFLFDSYICFTAQYIKSHRYKTQTNQKNLSTQFTEICNRHNFCDNIHNIPLLIDPAYSDFTWWYWYHSRSITIWWLYPIREIVLILPDIMYPDTISKIYSFKGGIQWWISVRVWFNMVHAWAKGIEIQSLPRLAWKTGESINRVYQIYFTMGVDIQII